MKTLYYGGKIITMAEPLYAEAVLVDGGEIVAVGNVDAMVENAGECNKINLEGKTMLPGFIDAHSHFSQVAMSFLQVSLDGASEVSEMKRRIREFISQNGLKKGQWINARDYDNNIMPNLQNPTLQELDDFAPDNPLVIHHKSGHMGLMNSEALRELDINEETPQIDGGKIEKKDGKLTGYLEENAFFTYLKKIPMPSVDILMKAFEAAQEKYASYGITTFQDGMFVKEMLPLYKMIMDSGMLKLDLVAFPDAATWDKAQKELGKADAHTHFKLGGIKAFLDGSPQGRTAWMRTPYIDDSSYCGYGTLSNEQLCNVMAKAAEENVQIICHCNGDGAAQQFLECLEKTEQVFPYFKNKRPVIIHGQLIGTDQLKVVARLGAMVSFFVAHVYHWGDVHIKNFGFERASKISPAASALKEGVKFTFHQDAPVINQDMLETIWCACARITKNGVCLGDDESISVYDAIKAVTVNGAYQYFEEKTKGTLEIGKRADMVILDCNPLETSISQLRDIEVCATIKDGRCVFCRNDK